LRETIDGAVFRAMVLCAADALERSKQVVNELNVFPVPDGDTGTNMSLTMGSAAAELRKKNELSLTEAADITASALLRGARGNSGVILSLLFRGLAKSLKGKVKADARQFAAAMADGVDAAYRAVMKPTEGTILTVSRMAAKSAREFAEAGSDFELMLVCALESAKDALEKTIEQNPVLKRAGVIDAGGQGYVIILDAMLASLQGRAAAPVTPEVVTAAEESARPREKADFSSFSSAEIAYAFDTVFIVRRGGSRPLELFRIYLESIGDSVVIGEDDDSFKVHVHTNQPGFVLTEAQNYGVLEVCKIENMRFQHDTLADTARDGLETFDAQPDAGAEGVKAAPPEKKYGCVAVCAGDGMEALFRELGTDGVVKGGQTMNPSTEDILREIEGTPAETVFVFPNNKNILMAAQQCAPLSSKKVIVIPTKNVPQGVAAMLCMDPYAEEEELRAAFTEAMDKVHTVLVTYASRDSAFDGHDIKANEYLALLDGGLAGSYTDVHALLHSLSVPLLQYRPEFLTVFYGADVSPEQAGQTAEDLRGLFPGAEVNIVCGGQPVYYYMISVE